MESHVMAENCRPSWPQPTIPAAALAPPRAAHAGERSAPNWITTPYPELLTRHAAGRTRERYHHVIPDNAPAAGSTCPVRDPQKRELRRSSTALKPAAAHSPAVTR
jgi:hypothetical protein